MIRTIVVDDERLARKELKNMLKEIVEIEVIAESGNPAEAVDLISKEKPDLVFLDIQMPGLTGFELLDELTFVPAIIFVTAYDEFAIKAFEVNALDYLLKPVDTNRLQEAVKKVLQQKAKEHPEPKEQQNNLIYSDNVFLKDGDKCWLVKLKDIRYFESEGNYVRVYFDEEKPLILKSLNQLEEKLNGKMFFRASRQHIINLLWVDKITNLDNNSLSVTLKKGQQVLVSRRQTAKFKDLMSL